MINLDFVVKKHPITAEMSSTQKKELLSTALKRTSEWIFSQDIPSDITIVAGGTSFSLHKFPLVSKCGYLRKLVSESSTDISEIEIPDIPGGDEAFELATRFCYGINFDISIENIAMLRCVSEYLEMTEDYAVGNLVGRTETFINEVALKTLAGAVTILHSSECLLPIAENVKMVSKCIDTIAFIACNMEFSPSGGNGMNSSILQPKPVVDWWAEDLAVLRIDMFQRVILAMISRGFNQYALGPVLMLYVQKSLRGLEIFGKGRKKIEPRQEHEKRVVLETIVSLLPREKNSLSVSFLSMLLRAAIYLETTVSCRLNLEKRIAMQLGQAVLDDLLIPAYSFTGDTLYDVETVQRIMINYLEYENDGARLVVRNADEEYVSPPPNDMERIGKLLESYLSEIASDRNLSVSMFISLAELIPEHSRLTEDGMYRSIDIYLKAHPALSDMERKNVCGVMDCQKLSREACAHAAQNDRLPVQTVVQVLYYEQQRLREAMDANLVGAESPTFASKVKQNSKHIHPASSELASLRTENQDLKLELVKMKMKLKEIEKPPGKPPLPRESVPSSPLMINQPSAGKPPLPRKSFISTVSKKLGKINPFLRPDGTFLSSTKTRTRPNKDRRHSIS